MRRKCYACGHVKEVFHQQENKEIDGKKYKINICYECWKDGENNG